MDFSYSRTDSKTCFSIIYRPVYLQPTSPDGFLKHARIPTIKRFSISQGYEIDFDPVLKWETITVLNPEPVSII